MAAARNNSVIFSAGSVITPLRKAKDVPDGNWLIVIDVYDRKAIKKRTKCPSMDILLVPVHDKFPVMSHCASSVEMMQDAEYIMLFLFHRKSRNECLLHLSQNGKNHMIDMFDIFVPAFFALSHNTGFEEQTSRLCRHFFHRVYHQMIFLSTRDMDKCLLGRKSGPQSSVSRNP